MVHRVRLTFLLSVGFAALALTPAANAQRRPRGPSSTDQVLTRSDAVDEAGRRFESRVVMLRRGDEVTYSVRSDDFDALARAEGPNGQTWEDDDGEGEGTHARLHFTAPVDGRYTLVATSYRASERGRFDADLSVRHGGSLGTPSDARDERDEHPRDDEDANDEGDDTAAPPSNAAGVTYGIFVGISRYRGENSDLPGSAEDAQSLARAFERAGWMQRNHAVVLTDEQATSEGVRQAFRNIAPRVGPRDLLVFFFDGHGNANELDLRGRDLTRRDLARALDPVRGRSLIVLDSCHAGGFSSVVRERPERAGLFSSRADEESSTAPQVGAGGWLAYHFRRAVEGGVSRSSDGSIALDDVVRFVEEGYEEHEVEDQHLVAVVGDRNGTFAIGGAGGDIPEPGAAPRDVMVARNDRTALPAMQPVPLVALAGAVLDVFTK
jgi:hypothetical protein